MKRVFASLLAAFLSAAAFGDGAAEPKFVCKDGVCYVEGDPFGLDGEQDGADVELAQGYMDESSFIAFLKGEKTSSLGVFSEAGLAFAFLLALVAGLAMNLTPCVLPMVPVNLMIIGSSARRGAAYGLGMAVAYGTLGLACALGGLAFGAIQSSAYFNLAVALVFGALGLSLCGIFTIDFSKMRRGLPAVRKAADVYAFLMGGLSAVLAGACVAPVLIALMLFTADMYSRGSLLALALPFAMGLGMALPWPLVGAGMKVLPRPGSWMKWVNRVFAVVVFGFSAWYAHLAYVGFAGNEARDEKAGVLERTVENFTLDGLERPVLVDCWASWCKNCKAMDEIVARPAVAQELKKFTFVKLQAEDISKLVRMPGFEKIKGLPAFVIFR